MKLIGNKTKGLTGKAMLDTLVMIAKNLEDTLPEHLTNLKSYGGSYISSFVRSCVPWATYTTGGGDIHNPFYGTNYAKRVKKKEIKHLEKIVHFDNKEYYDQVQLDDNLLAVPIFICTTLLENEGYYERDYLKEIIKDLTFGLTPDFVAKQGAKLFESVLRKKGYKEMYEEQNQMTQILLENKINLPEGVSLKGNVSGRDEDLFTYKDRYFLKSVYTPDNTSKELRESVSKYPALERYPFCGIDLFLGGIIYHEKGTNPLAHFIAKHRKQNALPFLSPQGHIN